MIRWIIIEGISKVNLIENLSNQFKFHPLVQEDILDPFQRPKIENFEKYLFIVLKMVHWKKEEKRIFPEQISFIFKDRVVITFQEIDTDIFKPIIDRLKNATGRVRKMGADYLLYLLVDIVIDNYFMLVDKIGKKIDTLEDGLIESPRIDILQMIHNLKREIVSLRKYISHTRNVLNSLQREESFIEGKTQIFIRDTYDHIIQIIDSFENFRDIISGMLDIYLSSVSNKMNEIMKILTIISTSFIPLSFLAGFYGMNFVFMPELHSPIAYPILIGVMVLIGILMIAFFKRKGWF